MEKICSMSVVWDEESENKNTYFNLCDSQLTIDAILLCFVCERRNYVSDVNTVRKTNDENKYSTKLKI